MMKRIVHTSFCVLMAIATLAFPVQAATRTWTGATSSDWFSAQNWNPAGVPAATDSVTIGGSVQLNGNATVSGLIFTGGAIGGTGTLTITGVGAWNAGDLSGQLK